MWHVTIASTRASVWAAIARLVVLPVFTTHTTHLLMSTLASLMKATHPTRIATAVVVVAEAVVVWASVPWTVVAVTHHPGRIVATHHHPGRSAPSVEAAHHAHATSHASVVTPALLPLLPTITVVALCTQAHAHPGDRGHPLHTEVGLVGGIGRNVRNLNMPWASAAVDDLVSNVLGEHGHEIVEHPTLG